MKKVTEAKHYTERSLYDAKNNKIATAIISPNGIELHRTKKKLKTYNKKMLLNWQQKLRKQQ